MNLTRQGVLQVLALLSLFPLGSGFAFSPEKPARLHAGPGFQATAVRQSGVLSPTVFFGGTVRLQLSSDSCIEGSAAFATHHEVFDTPGGEGLLPLTTLVLQAGYGHVNILGGAR